MTTSMPAGDDPRWFELLGSRDPGKDEAGERRPDPSVVDIDAQAASDLTPDRRPVDVDALVIYVSQVATHLALLTDEVRHAAQLSESRLDEVRNLVAQNIQHTSAVAAAAAELQGARGLTEQLSRVVRTVEEMSQATRDARNSAVVAVSDLESRNTAAMEGFRDALNLVAVQLSDNLLQVGARLGDAAKLGEAISRATQSGDDERLDRLEERLAWLVSVLVERGEA